jgi:hypothetical protein
VLSTPDLVGKLYVDSPTKWGIAPDTANGTARAGSVYTVTSGTLTFAGLFELFEFAWIAAPNHTQAYFRWATEVKISISRGGDLSSQA